MQVKIIAVGLILMLVFLMVGLSGCTDDYVEGTGTIQYNDFEGGFYGIVGDDGENYDPINLPEEFQVDGLRVNYLLKILDDQMSIHMWGKVVEVIEIEMAEN